VTGTVRCVPDRLRHLAAVTAEAAPDLDAAVDDALAAVRTVLASADARLARGAVERAIAAAEDHLAPLPGHLTALDGDVAAFADAVDALDGVSGPFGHVSLLLLDQRHAVLVPGSAADAAHHRRLLADLDAADPAGVAAILAELDRPTLLALARRDPALVGRLDGAPAFVRDHANRILLDAEVRRVELELARFDAAPAPTGGGRAGVTRRQRHAQERDAIVGRLATLTALRDRAGVQILVFDPAAGRVAAVQGDLDTADHVTTLVPGTGTGFGSINSYLDRARDLVRSGQRADPTGRVAAVAWLDYDAPPGLPQATSPGRADDASPDLGRFVGGVAVVNPDATRTLIGHSYGSTVVATAARDQALDLDALVGVASPGMRVAAASDLQLPQDGRVYAVTDRSGGKLNPFSGDPIHTVSDGVLTARLGRDPTRGGFGADSFEVGDAGGHDLTGYLDPSPGSVSGTNFGYLVTGRFDRLEATP
jgi:hypothetical protein